MIKKTLFDGNISDGDRIIIVKNNDRDVIELIKFSSYIGYPKKERLEIDVFSEKFIAEMYRKLESIQRKDIDCLTKTHIAEDISQYFEYHGTTIYQSLVNK